jgi:tRNA threonylcarbamoyladenosine biosynthesis protein TsaB
MALILNIETSTQVCSVALANDGRLTALKETRSSNSHSEILTVFIEEILKKNKCAADDLDAIAVSSGPGSYTGLRIGVSAAKGLCFATNKPLISVSTLQAMALGMVRSTDMKEFDQYTLFCPMIDARRMEVYTAMFDISNNEVKKVSAEIIDKDSFSDHLSKTKLVFFGDGASKCKEVLAQNANALFFDDIFPGAQHMVEISEQKFNNNDFEDLAYYEPFYLKDFIAGKPKVKGLY